VYKKKREGEDGERKREQCNSTERALKNRQDNDRGWGENANTYISQIAVKEQLGRVCHE
jgi:hypothetical protein